ncbi:alpha-lytic protease prodomain-containing protein [Streptosporangium sp. NPDC050855]|uniref:alpha-lytic protease prodomain-containing protein n=1 Tax=Streptosporangium sp. NPDC050855 TaxID=3366194 RepID=UPI0037A199E0
MSRNHTASMGRALTLIALTALAALAAIVGPGVLPLAATAVGRTGPPQAPPSPRATRAPEAAPAPVVTPASPARTAPGARPSRLQAVTPPPKVPWVPPDMLAALQRDLGLSREQVYERLLNEIALSSVEARLREELGTRFAGSWFSGLLSQTLVVATVSAADVPRITAAGARPTVVRWSLAQLIPIRKRIDAVLSAHPAGASVRYIDVRLNRVVVLSQRPTTTERIIKSIGVNSAAVVVLPSTEQPGPASRPSSVPERVRPQAVPPSPAERVRP